MHVSVGSPKSVGVIVASPDEALARDLSARLGEQARVAAVSNGYEAAACLLAGGSPVLVVDLRLIRGPHTQLLALARRRRLAVLGVGALPTGLTADDLAGVTLASRADLEQFVRAAIGHSAPALAAVTPSPMSAPAQAPTAPIPAPADAESIQPASADADTAAPAAPGLADDTTLEDEALLSLLEGRQEAPFSRGLDQEAAFELELGDPPRVAGPKPADQPAGQVRAQASQDGGAKPLAAPSATAQTLPTLEQGLLTSEELDALLGGD
jgi:hypothetical protein